MRKFRLIFLSTFAMIAGALSTSVYALTEARQSDYVRQVAQGRIPVPPGRENDKRDVNPIVYKAPSTDFITARNVIAKMVYNESWPNPLASGVGMYELSTDPSNPFVEQIIADYEMLGANGAAPCGNGMYYMTYVNNGEEDIIVQHNIYRMSDWSRLKQNPGSMETIAVSTTFSPFENIVYGVFLGPDGFGLEFCKFNPLMNVRTFLGKLGAPYSALAFDRDGSLYGISYEGNLVLIDKSDGSIIRTIGEANLPSEYLTSAVIDTDNGKMIYAHASPTTRSLYTIDLQTGEPEKICDYEDREEFVGMYMADEACEDLAPAAPTFSTPTFSNNGLTGKATIYMPSKTADGKELAGTLTYKLECNGELLAEGECDAKKWVNLDITLDSPGFKEFKTYCINDFGVGPAVRRYGYVGNATVSAPLNVKLESDAESESYRLSWSPVKKDTEGQMLPYAATYNVIMYPSGKTVANNISACEYTFTMPKDTSEPFWCGVVAKVSGCKDSSEALSNKMITEGLLPPIYEYFDTEESASNWTAVDADGCGNEYTYDPKYHRFSVRCPEDVPAEDWLISPALFLEAGKRYPVFVEAWSDSSDETIEFRVGQVADDLSSFETTVLEPKNMFNRKHNAYISVPHDGMWYLAIVTRGGMESNVDIIDCVRIENALYGTAPAPVSDFTLTPDEIGDRKCDISFVAPATDIDGNELTSLSAITLLRDGNIIRRWDNPDPGTPYTYTDTSIPRADIFEYSIYAENASGAGPMLYDSVKVGCPAPASPENVEVEVEPISGQITISWDEVTTDGSGNPLNPKAVRYAILSGKNVSELDDPFIATGLTETSYTFMPTETKQDYYGFAVIANTSGGDSFFPGYSDAVWVGPAYTLPFEESVPKGKFNYTWLIRRAEGSSTSWGQVLDSEGMRAQDGDGAFIKCTKAGAIGKATLSSARIYLDTKHVPVLSLWYYCIPRSSSTLEVAVSENQALPTSITTLKLDEGKPYEWNQAIVKLDAYQGKVIELYLNGDCGGASYICMDNVAIYDGCNDNLALANLSVPTSTLPGEEITLEATVKNFGMNNAKDWKLQLYRGNMNIATLNGEELVPGNGILMSYKDKLDALYDGQLEYLAVIDFDDDEEASDDEAKKAIEYVDPYFPTAAGIAAISSGEEVALSWSAPNLNPTGNLMRRDGTEHYESFSIGFEHSILKGNDNVGDWLMWDCDGVSTYKLYDPDGRPATYPNIGALMAFMVFNPDKAKLPYEALKPYGGKQCFASFQCDYKNSDDLMMSPELSGNEQTISFYAKSPYARFERLLISYSTTDRAITSFNLISSINYVSDEWTRYEVTLPEGAKYFAINCVSIDGVVLLLDDIVYEGKATEGEFDYLKLLGYNLYRDGKKVNTELLTTPSAIDRVGMGEKVSYRVSAVYNAGESAPSAEYLYDSSGIGNISAENVSIFTRRGHILINGAADEEVTIASTDGKLIYSTVHAPASVDVVVPTGIYVVRAADKVQKVTVY